MQYLNINYYNIKVYLETNDGDCTQEDTLGLVPLALKPHLALL